MKGKINVVKKINLAKVGNLIQDQLNEIDIFIYIYFICIYFDIDYDIFYFEYYFI
jgi:transcriptional regulator NrdR family protein